MSYSNVVHVFYFSSCYFCILFIFSFYRFYFIFVFYLFLFFLFRFLFTGLKAHSLGLKILAQSGQVEAQNAGPAVASQLSGALQAQACWPFLLTAPRNGPHQAPALFFLARDVACVARGLHFFSCPGHLLASSSFLAAWPTSCLFLLLIGAPLSSFCFNFASPRKPSQPYPANPQFTPYCPCDLPFVQPPTHVKVSHVVTC